MTMTTTTSVGVHRSDDEEEEDEEVQKKKNILYNTQDIVRRENDVRSQTIDLIETKEKMTNEQANVFAIIRLIRLRYRRMCRRK